MKEAGADAANTPRIRRTGSKASSTGRSILGPRSARLGAPSGRAVPALSPPHVTYRTRHRSCHLRARTSGANRKIPSLNAARPRSPMGWPRRAPSFLACGADGAHRSRSALCLLAAARAGLASMAIPTPSLWFDEGRRLAGSPLRLAGGGSPVSVRSTTPTSTPPRRSRRRRRARRGCRLGVGEPGPSRRSTHLPLDVFNLLHVMEMKPASRKRRPDAARTSSTRWPRPCSRCPTRL